MAAPDSVRAVEVVERTSATLNAAADAAEQATTVGGAVRVAVSAKRAGSGCVKIEWRS